MMYHTPCLTTQEQVDRYLVILESKGGKRITGATYFPFSDMLILAFSPDYHGGKIVGYKVKDYESESKARESLRKCLCADQIVAVDDDAQLENFFKL